MVIPWGGLTGGGRPLRRWGSAARRSCGCQGHGCGVRRPLGGRGGGPLRAPRAPVDVPLAPRGPVISSGRRPEGWFAGRQAPWAARWAARRPRMAWQGLRGGGWRWLCAAAGPEKGAISYFGLRAHVGTSLCRRTMSLPNRFFLFKKSRFGLNPDPRSRVAVSPRTAAWQSTPQHTAASGQKTARRHVHDHSKLRHKVGSDSGGQHGAPAIERTQARPDGGATLLNSQLVHPGLLAALHLSRNCLTEWRLQLRLQLLE